MWYLRLFSPAAAVRLGNVFLHVNRITFENSESELKCGKKPVTQKTEKAALTVQATVKNYGN